MGNMNTCRPPCQ